MKLLDKDSNIIELTYSKEKLWLKFFSHSNSLCTRAVRAIINHAPIREYCLVFLPQEEFAYSCEQYLIKMRQHILYEYKRFNNYWNPRQDTIAHFTLFLKFNSNAFSFRESITFHVVCICMYVATL